MPSSSSRTMLLIAFMGLNLSGFPSLVSAQTRVDTSYTRSARLTQKSFTITVDPKLSPFEFHASISPVPTGSEPSPAEGEWGSEMVTLIVLDSHTGDTIQAISDYPELLGSPAGLPDTVDANFDGYPDISILELQGATGNQFFSTWLYDKSQRQFVFTEAYSQLCNPKFDSRSKQIRTFEKCGGGCYYFATYVVQSDTPAAIAFVSIEPDTTKAGKDVYHCTEGRISASKKTILKESYLGEEVFDLPEVRLYLPKGW